MQDLCDYFWKKWHSCIITLNTVGIQLQEFARGCYATDMGGLLQLTQLTKKWEVKELMPQLLDIHFLLPFFKRGGINLRS